MASALETQGKREQRCDQRPEGAGRIDREHRWPRLMVCLETETNEAFDL